MNKRNFRLLIGLLISLSIDLAVRSAHAQPAVDALGAGPANFGLQDAVVDEIGWAEILPMDSSDSYSTTLTDGTAYRYLSLAAVPLVKFPTAQSCWASMSTTTTPSLSTP